jgi:hypothetical protein
VRSVATSGFWKLFQTLPPDVQELAVKSYKLWRDNPDHPSLRFRRLKGGKDRFTIRVGDHYRALGRLTDGIVTWAWIGTHAEYDRLVQKGKSR